MKLSFFLIRVLLFVACIATECVDSMLKFEVSGKFKLCKSVNKIICKKKVLPHIFLCRVMHMVITTTVKLTYVKMLQIIPKVKVN